MEASGGGQPGRYEIGPQPFRRFQHNPSQSSSRECFVMRHSVGLRKEQWTQCPVQSCGEVSAWAPCFGAQLPYLGKEGSEQKSQLPLL